MTPIIRYFIMISTYDGTYGTTAMMRFEGYHDVKHATTNLYIDKFNDEGVLNGVHWRKKLIDT